LGKEEREEKMDDKERSGTRKLFTITANPTPSTNTTPTARMVKNLLIIAGDEFVGAKDVSCESNGKFLLAARRKDNLWVALQITPQRGYKDLVERSKPRRQILGLKMASGQPLYVGWFTEMEDNRPHVCWGVTESKPYDAVNPDELQWQGGELLYIASLDGGECIVQDRREGKLYSEILPPLLFVAGRPLYRAMANQKTLLVWGTEESRPCDTISPPTLSNKMIVALGTEGVRVYEIIFKTAA
jgi:hypothetical protein